MQVLPRYMVRLSPKQIVLLEEESKANSNTNSGIPQRLLTERRILLGDLQGCPFVCQCLGAFNGTQALWLVFESCSGGALSSLLDGLILPQPNDRISAKEQRSRNASLRMSGSNRPSFVINTSLDNASRDLGTHQQEGRRNDTNDAAIMTNLRGTWRQQKRMAKGLPQRFDG